VTGLKGVEYTDSTDGGAVKVQEDDVIRFTGEVDRIYKGVKNPVTVRR
jgi:D-hexose-6-phosphate mutarotase